jgi:hypothetical protein
MRFILIHILSSFEVLFKIFKMPSLVLIRPASPHPMPRGPAARVPYPVMLTAPSLLEK